MRYHSIRAFLSLMLILPPHFVQAQNAAARARTGIAAYRSLEYETAVEQLRRALSDSGATGLRGIARAEPLMYLGASELMLGQAERSGTSFIQTLAVNPRHRADTLTFPPEVVRAFGSARLRTGYTELRSGGDTSIAPGRESFVVTAFISAPQHIEATLRRGGQTVRTLYSGRVQDSITISWNGLGESVQQPLEGDLILRVASAASAATSRPSELRVRAARIPVDTQVHPQQPVAATTARKSSLLSFSSLAIGAATGAAAILLPTAVNSDAPAMSERYVVGGALTLAGVAGFVIGRNKDQRQTDSLSNAMDRWRRNVATVRNQNATLLRAQRLRITLQSPE